MEQHAHDPQKVIRVVSGTTGEDAPVELQLGGVQRYWVHPNDFFGTEIEPSLNQDALVGIIYNQIEDASNPFGSIYSSFLTIEQMGEVPGTEGWNMWLQDLDLNSLRENLSARLQELVKGLEEETVVFLGLNLEKFKSVMLMMMDDKIGIDRVRIPQGSSAHEMFETYQSAATAGTAGKKFFYYPDGGVVPASEGSYSNMEERIAGLKGLEAPKFLAAIFADLLASTKDGEKPIEQSPRYESTKAFAVNVYQKFFAVTFAIRTNIEEDRPILLSAGKDGQEFTLREIKHALEEAKQSQ